MELEPQIGITGRWLSLGQIVRDPISGDADCYG